MLEVRILHGAAPEFFLCRRQLGWAVTGLMDRAEHIEQIGERVQHPTGIEVPESEHAAVCAARVVRKDGFQRGMSLRGRTPLFAGIARNADHSDLAV